MKVFPSKEARKEWLKTMGVGAPQGYRVEFDKGESEVVRQGGMQAILLLSRIWSLIPLLHNCKVEVVFSDGEVEEFIIET